jgi:hypothetical protein
MRLGRRNATKPCDRSTSNNAGGWQTYMRDLRKPIASRSAESGLSGRLGVRPPGRRAGVTGTGPISAR